MRYVRRTSCVAVVCGVGGLLVFALFEGRQTSETAAPERETPAPAIAVSPALPRQNPAIQRKPNPITQLEEALQSRDEPAITAALSRMDGCSHCQERLAALLDDPSLEIADKLSLGRALIQAGTQAGTLLVVNAILHASQKEESDLKDGLLQALADAQTPESTAALVGVITGEVADLNFQELPADLQYAIQKAIKLNPDGERTGQLLADSYRRVSPEIARNLENVQHPTMAALLATEAYASKDMARTEQLIDLLSGMHDPRALESMMSLGKENIFPLEEANRRTYTWATEHGEQADQSRYAAYLSDFDANAAQRSMAAFALAAFPDTEEALSALEKAYDHESDPLVRSNLESAMNLIRDPSDPQHEQ